MKAKIVVLIFLLFLSCKQNAQPQSGFDNLNEESIQYIIEQEVSKFLKPPYVNLSGIIYINGKSHQFHFGKLLNGKSPNNETIYEIGSITKTYTGLILSQAVSDKKVFLDEDIRKYLKGSYPNLELNSTTPITLKHLITHTSGIPPIINCEMKSVEEQIECFENFTKDDFFDKLKNVNLIDKSGNNYHYSNAGIQLVGYILENVYDLSSSQLIDKYVFSRSKEKNTFYKIDYNDSLNMSLGQNNEKNPMPLINGFYNYAGGFKSSTNSMAQYIKMYLESQDPVVLQTMNRLAGNTEYGRAYAWNTYNYDKSKKMLYHNGGTFGHSSWIALYPNQKTGIFLVTNILTENSQGELNQLSNNIIDKLLQ